MGVAVPLIFQMRGTLNFASSVQKLDLSEDVAGATFMAAGSSAPELFASVIGKHTHTHTTQASPQIVPTTVEGDMC